MPARRSEITARHAGLLGTVIEVSAGAATPEAAEAGHRSVVAEIERLQKVFDAFDPSSTLRRWLAGTADPSPELIAVVDLAEGWRRRSGGAFDPAAALLSHAWGDAARRDRALTSDELQGLIQEVAEVRRPSAPAWVPPTVAYALNAIAKGWIVDRALEAAWRGHTLESLTVNAGGDLAHRGSPPIAVGIEDPARPFDNAAPLLAVRVGDQALATSGGARRGWTIGGTWYSHVLDPRSGRPVDHHASVSVLALDAATADVVATVVGVKRTDEAIAFIDDLDDATCCIVSPDGSIRRSRGWGESELRPEP